MEDQAAELRAMMGSRPQKKPKIITVTGGKGGVGKTNVAINLAIAYAQEGKSVILIDADLGLANVHMMLNVTPKYNLWHVLTKQKTLSEVMYKTNFGFRVISGPNGFSQIANLPKEYRDYFIDEMKALSSADIIIIDTSAGVSDSVISFVSVADIVLLVTTPEPTAYTDAYGLLKIVSSELAVGNFSNGEAARKDVDVRIVLNRANSAAEGKKIFDRIANCTSQFLLFKVEYAGFVYNDPVVTNSVLRQNPFIVAAPQSKPAVCVRHIAKKLENVEVNDSEPVESIFSRLFSRRK